MRRLLLLLLGLVACVQEKTEPPPPVVIAVKDPVVIELVYGSEKKTWIDGALAAFAGAKTGEGRPISVKATAMGSGEAVQGILDGSLKPTVFSPASSAYVALLNHRWLSAAGHTKAISPAGEPVVLSPIVIAMWQPLAESLGWPSKSIGWRDLLSISSELRLGHTHPAFSNSGLLAVLAEAYAGAKKTRGLTIADLDAKETQDFVNSIERTIVHYGKSTGFFAEKMIERGPDYLSAAILYENLVIESYAKQSRIPIVAIYPIEGTFWSDHPYAILDAPWVGAPEREAAEVLLAHLKTRAQQQAALALGFRPADPTMAIGSPIDFGHGVDPKQPQTLLEVPSAPVLERLIALWQLKKKPADVILVFDRSGSMEGRPLQEAKAGARAFIENLTDSDRVSLLPFHTSIPQVTASIDLATGRARIIAQIDRLRAQGGTALYDAIDRAHFEADKRAKDQPDRIHAVLVMTDGNDQGSVFGLGELKDRLAARRSNVKLFSIAYGDQVDGRVLEQIAEAAGGASAKGSTESIVQVYRDMASFF